MFFILLAAGIFVLDYVIKEQVNSSRLQGSSEEVLKGRFILRNCHNKGGALGLFKSKEKLPLEASALTLGGVIWEFTRRLLGGGKKLTKLGLSMILGGGLGNYIDRRNKGYVTDYVSIGVKNKKIRNLVFNISDFFIMAGTLIWLISSLLPSGKKK